MPRLSISTLSVFVPLSASIFLAGCALQSTAPPVAQPGVGLQGSVFGGQQPVTGAHIYLYAAGSSAYGGAAASLLTPVPGVTSTDSAGTFVTSDASGSFSLTGDYTCTPGQQLYLLGTGGNPGLGGNKNNAALSLLAALGACPANGAAGLANNFVVLNELTTVAAAYALSGFFTDPTHLSSGASVVSQRGLANAFLNASSLVDLASGRALTSIPGNGSVPQARLNTLANLLAACVNSDGTGTACASLFSNARSGPSGTVPSDVASAAINIAHHQTANISSLFALQFPAAPFAPSLSSAPTDFTLPITFSPPNFAANHLAIDAVGNVYFAGSSNFVSELQSNGTPAPLSPFSPDDTVTSISGICLEATGNVWLTIDASSTGAAVAKFTPDLTEITRFGGTHFNGISTGLPGDVFSPSTSQDLVLGVHIPLTGPGVQFNRLFGNGLTGPVAVATSSTGIEAILNTGSSMSSFLQDGTPNGNVSVGATPSAVAIDSSDTAWTANTASSTLTATKLAVGSLNTVSYTTALDNPISIVIDGNPSGTGVWYTNTAGLVGGAVAGLPISSTGISTGQSSAPLAIAADPSGDLWTANGTSATQFIGLSVPVATPVLPSQLGVRP